MRLLSYNIHKGIGGRDRRYDLRRIIRVIEHENPDLICLQEVTRDARRTRHDNQPALLRAAFPVADLAYQMNHHYHVGGYGNLVLSRWPFARRHQVSLRHGWRKARGCQLVVVETPEGLLHLANWHLGLAEHERQWQVAHLFHHALFRESVNLPTLIVGDSNDWRNTLEPTIQLNHDFVQVTVPPSRFRSFPAFLPTLSLDKAYHHGLFVHECRVVRTPLAHRASDHLPLVIDFHLHDRHP